MKMLKLGLLTAFTLGSLIATGPVVARHGAGDPRGDMRGPRNDDPANHDAVDNRGQDVNDVNDVMDDLDVADLDEAVENQQEDVGAVGNDDHRHHH